MPAFDAMTDMAYFVAIFLAFFVVDRSVLALARLPEGDVESSVLVLRALQDHTPIAIAGLAAFVFCFIFRRPELFIRWNDLEHGQILRQLATPVVVLLAWRYSTYDYNFIAEQWHWIDRILLISLAFAAIARPVFLIPLAFHLRVILQQFLYPVGVSMETNITDLLVMLLLAMACGHLLFVVTRRTATAPSLALTCALLAGHFFRAGRLKLGLEWVADDHIANLALSSYTAGWLGSGDGHAAKRIADIAESINRPILVLSLLIELGVIVAITRPRLFRVWLLGAASFHAAIFIFTGFSFLEWTVMELALFIALTRPGLMNWLQTNWTPAQGVVLALVVVFATPVLFHPPGLAWLDSPVSYGYAVYGIGASGTHYQIDLNELGPFEEDVAFMNFQFAPRLAPVSGYGAAGSVDVFKELEAVGDFDQLSEIETELSP